jgi:putative restriction endonuclease
MHDNDIRQAAFEWLELQNAKYNEVLPWKVLANDFHFNSQRITLIGQKGIWKPKQMALPISITTTINSPYSDHFKTDDLFSYSYRGTNPRHSDNAGLRELMRQNIPLIYFISIAKGKYMAASPVFIENDDPANLSFVVRVDSKNLIFSDNAFQLDEPQHGYDRRSYITAQTQQRVHQKSFRERVLHAYKGQCAICNLKHIELLDAAHIISDSDPDGIPIVPNGLALCKIHHAAFDQNIIGINPDYKILVREDILEEEDGPMLKHGIQALNQQRLILPSRKANHPDKDRLDRRFQQFLSAG